MVTGAAIAIGLLASGLSIPQLFLVVAIMNAVVTFYIFNLVPEFLMRFFVWALVHSIYRLRIDGIEMHSTNRPVFARLQPPQFC